MRIARLCSITGSRVGKYLMLVSLMIIPSNVLAILPQDLSSRSGVTVAGRYRGFVESETGQKPATLEIKEQSADGAYDFTLEVAGEKITGRIAVNPYSAGAYAANVRFEENADFFSSWEVASLSARFSRKGKAVTLNSIEGGKTFAFYKCLPPPGCKEQPKCRPCST